LSTGTCLNSQASRLKGILLELNPSQESVQVIKVSPLSFSSLFGLGLPGSSISERRAGDDDEGLLGVVKKRNCGFPGDVWELLSSASDLISLPSSNNESKRNETSGRTAGAGTLEEDFLRSFPPTPTTPISSNLNVVMRLRKLDYYFSTLGIWDQDCRHRALCEVAKDPAKYSPLAIAFLDETRFVALSSLGICELRAYELIGILA